MKRASVVVAVVVFLTCSGLFAGAVVRVRQAAAQTQCANNLKQFGLAIRNYHDVYKKFPIAITKYTIGPRPQERVVELPIDKSASWLFELHPFIEARMDPRFRIDINKPWDAEENRYVADNEYWLAQCPAKFSDDRIKNSYIGILGVGPDAGWLAADDRARGLFDFRTHAVLDHIKDGSNNTMMVAETAFENGRWIAGGYPTARGLDLQGSPYLGRAGQFSSLHPGNTTLAVMADGSVRKLTDAISDNVFEALATIAGDETVRPLPD